MKLKNKIIAFCCILFGSVMAQTTVSTNHTNNNGNGSIIFNIQNTNTFAITITDLSCHLGSTTNNNLQLLYNPTPYFDNAAPWSFGTVAAGQNGWISAATGTINSNSSNGVVTALSGICLSIPAGVTYQFGFSATTLQYMTLTSGTNTFSAGGVNLITGDGIGWGGAVYPSTPGNHPRGFIGGVTFVTTTPGTPPTVPSLATSNGTICSGGSTTLSISSGSLNSALNWQWYSASCGGTSVGSGTSIVVSPTVNTNYYARGEGGCGFIPGACGSVSVVVDLPFITANPASTIICNGQSVVLNGGGASTYTWSGGITNNVAFSPTVSGSYTVTGTNTLTGCAGTNVAVTSITLNPNPTVTTLSSASIICAGQTVTLTASGANTYTWSTATTGSVITDTPMITTTYTVTGEDTNGCIGTDIIQQSVSPCTGIELFNSEIIAVRVYPNPGNGLVMIELPYDATVTVMNALGEIISNRKLSQGNHQLNIINHVSGIYFVKVHHDEYQQIIRLIKE